MKKTLFTLLTLALGTGCVSTTRTPEQYHDETAAAFAQQESAFKTCYDDQLKKTPDAKGTVTLDFWWASGPDDSRVVGSSSTFPARVIPPSSTAPEELQQCVLGVAKKATLHPKGGGMGHARWTFTFEPGAAPTAAPSS